MKTAPVVRLPVAPTLELPGTALAWRQVTVGASEAGRVTERVKGWFSAAVEEGDVLVRLDDRRARARLRAAEARTRSARERYAEAQAGERPERVAEARADLRRAQAASKEADRNLQRIRDLRSRSAATQAQLDQAERASEVAREETRAASSRLDRILAGTRSEQLRQQEADWHMAQAEEELARIALGDHQIRAPFSGYVDKIHMEVGSWLDVGESVVDMVDLRSLDVTVLVPEDRVHRVPVGAEARCRFPSVGTTLERTGTVVSVGPLADLRGRTVPVLVRVQNPEHRLRAGMSARVEVPLEKPRPRTLVPKDAVLRALGAPPRVVLVVDGKAESRVVELGNAYQEKIEILSGVTPGDQVVVRGNERLQPGQEVSPE